MPHPRLVIWRFVDGKPGHEKQSLGLAQALRRLSPNPFGNDHEPPPSPPSPASDGGGGSEVVCHDIEVRQFPRPWLDWLLGRFPAGRTLPGPDLLIGAGHATHFPMLAARRAFGGRAVVLMRPSLPLGLFDLCLIPEHDRPPRRDNVIATRGVLNAVAANGNNRPERGLILIGGPSAHHAWADHAVADQLLAVVQRHRDVNWQLTTSRRTPARFLATLPADLPTNLAVVPHTVTPPGWLEAELCQCGQAWVTEDSVSMLYEALTAGCVVGLMRLPGRRSSRVSLGLSRLVKEGWVTPYEAWQNSGHLVPPPGRFDEAARCAQLILDTWLHNAN